MKFLTQNINTILLLLIAMALGAIVMRLQTGSPETQVMMNPAQQAATVTPEPSETIPPYTPFASHTPTTTLKPPPTFEPPTATPAPSLTPSVTPSPTIQVESNIEGIIGLASPTALATPEGCEPRAEWKLRYTVQPNDALQRIAAVYNTSADELALGNCLPDINLIREGQILRVPGDVQPSTPEQVCEPYEALTPFNDSQTVPGDGTLNFNWRGTEAPRQLLIVTRPDGSRYEEMIELRQNTQLNLYEDLFLEGRYYWFIRPLNFNFVQVCPDSPTWTFVKVLGPTPTPVTPTATTPPDQVAANFQSDVGGGVAPLTIQFLDKSSGPIVSYYWDFGDGTSSTQRDPVHTFNTAGSWIVSLTVVSSQGVADTNRQIFVVN